MHPSLLVAAIQVDRSIDRSSDGQHAQRSDPCMHTDGLSSVPPIDPSAGGGRPALPPASGANLACDGR
jgi:hypothetical protein